MFVAILARLWGLGNGFKDVEGPGFQRGGWSCSASGSSIWGLYTSV